MYGNDDAQATRQSTLPALDPLTPAAPGVYLLGDLALQPRPARRRRPDLPGLRWRACSRCSDEPLSSLVAHGPPGGTYGIALTGTTACAPPDQTPPTVDLRVPADGASVARGLGA